jgi:hypothetical protein
MFFFSRFSEPKKRLPGFGVSFVSSTLLLGLALVTGYKLFYD